MGEEVEEEEEEGRPRRCQASAMQCTWHGTRKTPYEKFVPCGVYEEPGEEEDEEEGRKDMILFFRPINGLFFRFLFARYRMRREDECSYRRMSE